MLKFTLFLHYAMEIDAIGKLKIIVDVHVYAMAFLIF